MYKRRIILGGAAPAAVLALGFISAGPAMAGTTTPGLAQAPAGTVSNLPGSLLSSVPGGSMLAGGLQGLSPEVPALSSLPLLGDQGGNTSSGTSDAAGTVTNAARNVTGPSGPLGGAEELRAPGAATGALGGAAGAQADPLSGRSGQDDAQDSLSPLSGVFAVLTGTMPGTSQAESLLNGAGDGPAPSLNSAGGELSGPASAVTRSLPIGGSLGG